MIILFLIASLNYSICQTKQNFNMSTPIAAEAAEHARTQFCAHQPTIHDDPMIGVHPDQESTLAQRVAQRRYCRLHICGY